MQSKPKSSRRAGCRFAGCARGDDNIRVLSTFCTRSPGRLRRSGIPRRPRIGLRAEIARNARLAVLFRDKNSACPKIVRVLTMHARKAGKPAGDYASNASQSGSPPPNVESAGRSEYLRKTGTKPLVRDLMQIRESNFACLWGYRRALTSPQISSHLGSTLGLAGLDTTLLFWGYLQDTSQNSDCYDVRDGRERRRRPHYQTCVSRRP